MNLIKAEIYTLEKLNSHEIAHRFFKKADVLGIQPEFISFVEPINHKYTLEDAVEYWNKAEVWDTKNEGNIGKSGLMLARNRSLSITYFISWTDCHEKRVNYISFYVSFTKYKKIEKEFFELFKDTIISTNAIYGFVGHSDTIDRQHATGGIEHRIPGMFWCNYFSKIYIDFFGREKFESSNWFKREKFGDDGVLIFLDDKPYNKILTDISIEEKAKHFLGYDSFANKKEEEMKEQEDEIAYANSDPIQYKNVPKII